MDRLMWICPLVQHANLQTGPLDEWTNPHQAIHSKFEVRNWTEQAWRLPFGVINLMAAGAGFVQLSSDLEEFVGVLFLDRCPRFVRDVDNNVRLVLPFAL